VSVDRGVNDNLEFLFYRCGEFILILPHIEFVTLSTYQQAICEAWSYSVIYSVRAFSERVIFLFVINIREEEGRRRKERKGKGKWNP